MAKALVLRAITGTNAGQRHTLSARVNTIGSAANNDLVRTGSERTYPLYMSGAFGGAQ